MRATASKSALILSGCTYWMRDDAEWYDEDKRKPEDLFARDAGIVFHDAIDAVWKGTLKPEAVPAVVARRVGLAWSWLQEFATKHPFVATEIPVAHNFESEVSFYDEISGRAYVERPGFINGTADLVAISDDGYLVVGDWKTGGGGGAAKQLLTLACGFQKLLIDAGFPKLPVRTIIMYVTDDIINAVVSEPTGDEVEEHSFNMACAANGKPSKHNPGIHCTQLFCPHLGHCEAIAGVVNNAAEGHNGLLPPRALVRKYSMTDEPSSDEHAGWVMERVTAAKRQLNYYEEGMRRYLANGGKVISGEYEWRKTNNGVRWGKR